MPIKHIDGIVAHNYGVIVVPADDKVPSACYIERSVVSVEDAFSTQEGGTDLYTHDAVKPDDGSRMVKWGQITVTKDNATGKITKRPLPRLQPITLTKTTIDDRPNRRMHHKQTAGVHACGSDICHIP